MNPMMNPFMRMDSTWFIFVLPAMIFAMFAQGKIQRAYSQYSRVNSDTGMTGAQVARMILDRNGLQDVRIEETPGQLTDHYDPRTRVVRLSQANYRTSSVAAVSVAAHECGHAIQHATDYTPLRVRSTIAPIVSISSRFVWVFIALGFIVSSLGPLFIEIGIAIFLGTVIFQIVTLPVEFDASRRALIQLENGIARPDKVKGSKEVLTAAALTYVAATITAIGQLLRLLAITSDQRRRD